MLDLTITGYDNITQTEYAAGDARTILSVTMNTAAAIKLYNDAEMNQAYRIFITETNNSANILNTIVGK